MKNMVIDNNNFYEILVYFASIGQGLSISSGSGPIEKESIQRLEKIKMFGELISTQEKLEIFDPSRKTNTYKADAIFETKNKIYIVDIKPSNNDNSTSPLSHTNKFISAREILSKKTTKKVECVIAVYGSHNTSMLESKNYYQTFIKQGIKVISLLDVVNLTEEDIQEIKVKHFIKIFTKLSLSAIKKGKGTIELHQHMLQILQKENYETGF